jgi:hypothetical protein
VSARAWGPVDPNSTHQRWSAWRITLRHPLRWPEVAEVRENAMRFARRVFRSSVGQVRCDRAADGYVIQVRIEGPAVTDPAYVRAVGRAWQTRFAVPGLGATVQTTMTARLLAGSPDDGRPRAQLIVAPPLVLTEAAGG